jgi:hypothetical protein
VLQKGNRGKRKKKRNEGKKGEESKGSNFFLLYDSTALLDLGRFFIFLIYIRSV